MIDEDKNGIDDTITKDQLARCDTEMLGDAAKSGIGITPDVVSMAILKKQKRQNSWWFKLIEGTKDKIANSGPELLFKIGSTIAIGTGGIILAMMQGWFNV